MRIEGRDSGLVERRILIAMVLSSTVLGRIALRWESELFASKASAVIGGWCVKYYLKHKQAPGKTIQSMFEAWSEKHPDKDTVALVERLLVHIANEHETDPDKDINPDHVIEIAEKHFNTVKTRRFKDALEGDLENGTIDEALERIAKFGKVEMSGSAGIDAFHNQEVLRQAIDSITDPILEYPGDAGEFLDPVMERDAFVVIFGQSKSGKTGWLMDLAVRSAKQRNRTAYFQVGDLSLAQTMRRLASRTSGRPLWASKVKIPVSLSVPDRRAVVEHEERELSALDWRSAWDSFVHMQTKFIKSQDSYFKISVHPNSSISINGIDSVLSRWADGGWVADCVIIDYLDLLAPIDSRKADPRQNVVQTWRAARGLSQSRHLLLVSATQTNASSFTANTLNKTHFSESRTKFDDVTAALAINQEKEEKVDGVQRLTWLDARDISNHRTLYCAGARAICNPLILSCMK